MREAARDPRIPSDVQKRQLREDLQVRLARDHGFKTGHLSLNDCVAIALEHGLSWRTRAEVIAKPARSDVPPRFTWGSEVE